MWCCYCSYICYMVLVIYIYIYTYAITPYNAILTIYYSPMWSRPKGPKGVKEDKTLNLNPSKCVERNRFLKHIENQTIAI